MRNDLNILRKLFHLSMGLLIVALYQAGMERSLAVSLLAIVLVVEGVLEVLRLKSPAFNRVAIRLWKPIMRTDEVNRISGVPFYAASALIAIGIFPKPVAILSLLYLAVGDPAASLFGILWGKYGPRFRNGKSLVGTGAAVLVCFLLTAMVTTGLGVAWPLWIGVALMGGLAGGMAEWVPVSLDDNFTIPVISGFAMWLVWIALSLPV